MDTITAEKLRWLEVDARKSHGRSTPYSNGLARAADAIEHLERERDEAKAIVAKCCNAPPNGAHCTPDASIEFMHFVPDEVLLVTAHLTHSVETARARVARLEEALKAYIAADDNTGNPAASIREYDRNMERARTAALAELSKHICDEIQQQAQDHLDRQSGRLWELVREDQTLMAAE